MCSKYDSDATYCSEVEELLEANNVPRKSCEKMPLRRSQRLSQILKKEKFEFNWNNFDIARSKNVIKKGNIKGCVVGKHTPDIFSILDLKEEEEMERSKAIGQHYISLNEILCCTNQVFKHIPETSGVPLDLSKKSKASIGETPPRELNVATATVEFNKCIVKNPPDAANIYNKEMPKLSLPKKKLMHRNKSKRQRISSDMGKVFKTDLIKTLNSTEDITYIKNISSDNKNCCESLLPLKKNSLLVAGRRANISSNTRNSSKTTCKCSYKSGNKNLKAPDPSATYFCNEISEKKPIKTPAPIEFINQPVDVSCDNKNNSKSTTTGLRHLKKDSILISDKGIGLTNKNINTNKLNNQTKLNVTSAENNSRILAENDANNSKIESETKIRESTLHKLHGTYFNKIEPVVRSQKRKCQSDKIILKTKKTQSNELQHIHQNTKSEPFTSLDTYTKTCGETNKSLTPFSENSFLTIKTKNNFATKKLRNNSSQMTNETFISKEAINTKSSSELKSHRVLRNSTSTIRKELSAEDTANIQNKSRKLENKFKNIKTEIFSQKTSEENIQIKTSQKNYRVKKTKSRYSQRINEYELNTNELKNVNNNTESHLQSSNGTIVFCKDAKPVNSIQQINQLDVSSQIKMEIETKKPALNKNYIKSFDRSQFLDKIQNSKNYIDTLSAQNNNYSKLNNFEIPLTPVESSQDLLKKPILPDVYPPYFKDQLPPEAVFTKSLDLKPHATDVITPDDTISSELLESSSSSPSLPESLCELFQTKDIKDILNVERTSYRLYSHHIQALALILNLRLDYLIKILEKVITISPNVLKSIGKAVKMQFVPDNDIFSTSSAELWTSSDVVLNSQSPKQRRIYKTN